MSTQTNQTNPLVTPDRIMQVASGFMSAKHLFAANGIGLFAQLADGPVTLEHIAERSGLPYRTVRIVTDAMTALGFVERNGNTYWNAPVAQVFLSGKTPADLRPFLRFWDQISYRAWTHLEDAVRDGKAPMPEMSPELDKVFSEGVAAVTAGTAIALAQAYDWSRHKRVIDLGGGTGSFLAPILRRHKLEEAALFELPQVTRVAERVLAGDPVTASVKIIAGDLFSDPIPTGYDAAILANVIHYFQPANNQKLLRLIRAASQRGTRLLAVDTWTDASHTQPPMAALLAGEFLMVTPEGDVYSQDEFRQWLFETGWQALEHKPLAGPFSLIVAEAI